MAGHLGARGVERAPRPAAASAARRALQGAGGLSRTFSGAERNGHSRRVGRAARHCEINLKFSFPLHPFDLPTLPSLHIPFIPPPPCLSVSSQISPQNSNPQRVTVIFKKSECAYIIDDPILFLQFCKDFFKNI